MIPVGRLTYTCARAPPPPFIPPTPNTKPPGDFAHWKAPKGRRRYLNEGRRAGLVVEELSHAELTYGERMRVGEVNARWLKAKAGFGGELQLMTHPFDVEDEVSWVGRSIDWEGRKERCMRACVPRLLARSLQDHHHPENTLGRSIHWWYVCLGWLARPTANTHHPSPNPPTNNAQWQVRKFYCFDRPRSHPESVLLAFIFFTPCFRGGRTVGYNANILRRDPTLERPNYGGWVGASL